MEETEVAGKKNECRVIGHLQTSPSNALSHMHESTPLTLAVIGTDCQGRY